MSSIGFQVETGADYTIFYKKPADPAYQGRTGRAKY